MTKAESVALLQQDIKELANLTEGFAAIETLPLALLTLAEEKAEHVKARLVSLHDYEQKAVSVSPSLYVVDEEPVAAAPEVVEETPSAVFVAEETEEPVAEPEVPEVTEAEAAEAESTMSYEQTELTLDFGEDIFSAVPEEPLTESTPVLEEPVAEELQAEDLVIEEAKDETPVVETPEFEPVVEELPIEEPAAVEEEPVAVVEDEEPIEELESLDDVIEGVEELDEVPVVAAPVAAAPVAAAPVAAAPAAPATPAVGSSDSRVRAFLQKYAVVGGTRNESLLHTSIDDIGRAMSLGDQFYFKHVLFGDNGELMNKTIAALNGASSYDDAVLYIVERFSQKWDAIDQATVSRFMEVVQRRFI